MKRLFFATLLGMLLLVAGACKSKTENNDAIKAGVVKHISAMGGMNVNNMDIVVMQATMNGDKAQASVEIRAKNSDPSMPPMQVDYQLEKRGSEWVVIKAQPTGGMQHPAPGEMPPGGTMPPGHPNVSGTSGQLPASHSDFNSIMQGAQPPAQQAPAQAAPSPQKPPSTNQP